MSTVNPDIIETQEVEAEADNAVQLMEGIVSLLQSSEKGGMNISPSVLATLGTELLLRAVRDTEPEHRLGLCVAITKTFLQEVRSLP